MLKPNRTAAALLVALAALSAAGCGESNADKVSYLVEGRCSFEDYESRLDVICKEPDKNGKPQYRKSSIGLGDQDSWASTQIETINVSEYRTKIIFRPESIVPDLDLVTGS